MATAIGLTAARWDSQGGSAEYGPVVDTIDWNSWTKYFEYDTSLSSGCAVTGYTGTNLGDVIFPEHGALNKTVKIIYNTVFQDPTKKELPVVIYISGTVETIEAMAFSNLPNLEKVVFAADGVAINVGAYAFAGCPNLKEVVLGANVTYDPTAFKGCYNLTTVGSLTAEQVNALK